MTSVDPEPVTQQPTQEQHDLGPAPGEGPGPVQVRPMVKEDAEFVGRLTVEGFEGKFKWAIGENK